MCLITGAETTKDNSPDNNIEGIGGKTKTEPSQVKSRQTSNLRLLAKHEEDGLGAVPNE